MMVPLFLAFLCGAAAALVAFRRLAQTNRTVLYQLLSIDTSFAEPSMGTHGVRDNDPSAYASRKGVSSLPDPIRSSPHTIVPERQSVLAAQQQPESVAPDLPTVVPPEQTLYSEQAQLAMGVTKRRPHGSLSIGGTNNAPVAKSTSNSEIRIAHQVAAVQAAEVASDKSSSLGAHLTHKMDSHVSTPSSVRSDRLHGSGNHSANHSDAEDGSKLLSVPLDSRRNKKNTPVLERHGSGAMNAEQEKLKKKQEIAAFYAAEPYSGWVKLGSIMAKKLKWKWRFVVVQGGWLHYYKTEEKRGNNCCGWVILTGTEVGEKPKNPGQIVIKNVKGKKMFHRHGPDPSLPPAKKDGFLFGHRKSAKCRILVKDKDKLEEWLNHLKRASQTQTASAYIESDDEDVSIDESDNASCVSDEDVSEVVVEKIPTSTTPLPTTAKPHGSHPPIRRIARADSIIIVRPEADKEVEVPAPQEFVRSRRDTLRYSLIGVSSPVVESPKAIETTATPGTEALNAPAEEELLEDSVSTDNREGLGKILAKAIGLDLTTIALPVTLNEPQSFLQRMCEAVQYYDLLNKADAFDDPHHRMTYVAAFAATAYSCSTRTTKPFNPYLGETFELVRPDGFKYLGEQVSHHPPVGAGNATSAHFDFHEEQGVKSKFGGNSLNIETIGIRQLRLKKLNDYYSWAGIKTTAHNILLGEMWVDHYGRTEITCPQTKTTAILEFTKCGWFSKGRYEVKGWITDSHGKTVINLEGKWMEQLEATVLNGPNFPGTSGKTHTVWKHTNVPDQPDYKYKFTPFTREMNKRDGIENILPATDSRLRKDRIALEDLDIKKAGAEKRILEERERRIRKQRETKGIVWKPKYFVQDQDNAWAPLNAAQYWAERQQRISEKTASV